MQELTAEQHAHIQTVTQRRAEYQRQKRNHDQERLKANADYLETVIRRMQSESEKNKTSEPKRSPITLPNFINQIYRQIPNPKVRDYPMLAETLKTVFEWQMAGRPYSLALSGIPGCGKSTILHGVKRLFGGKWVIESDLLYSYSRVGSECFWDLKGHGLLIVDEVGIKETIPFMKQDGETMQGFFDDFYKSFFDYARPNETTQFLIATNLSIDGLFYRIGSRAVSRFNGLFGNGRHFIRMESVPDFRSL